MMAKWWIIGAAVFLAVLLIASIALALTTSQEAEFAGGTPERAVQDLLRAAEDEDIEAAYGMLSQELQGKCALEDYADGSGYRHYDDGDRDIRATLRDSKLVGDTTFVDVRITQFYGSGPFGSSESTYNERYALRQEGGEWRFTEYPWPYDWCPEDDE